MIRQIYIFIYKLYRFLGLIYQIFTFLFEVIDKIVEAVMTRTIYRLTDSQKYVMILFLLLLAWPWSMGITLNLCSFIGLLNGE